MLYPLLLAGPKIFDGQVLRTLTQTSLCAPSQWEGTTEAGQDFYARSRHGRFSVEINGVTVIDMHHPALQIPDPMSTQEMLQLTGFTVDHYEEYVDRIDEDYRRDK